MAKKGYSFGGLVEYIQKLVAGTESFTAINNTGRTTTQELHTRGATYLDGQVQTTQAGEAIVFTNPTTKDCRIVSRSGNSLNWYLGTGDNDSRPRFFNYAGTNYVELMENGTVVLYGSKIAPYNTVETQNVHVGLRVNSTNPDCWVEYQKLGQAAYSTGINSDNRYTINITNGSGEFVKGIWAVDGAGTTWQAGSSNADGGVHDRGHLVYSPINRQPISWGGRAWTGWTNTFDNYQEWETPHAHVIYGMASEHSGGSEDRRFKFRYGHVS